MPCWGYNNTISNQYGRAYINMNYITARKPLEYCQINKCMLKLLIVTATLQTVTRTKTHSILFGLDRYDGMIQKSSPLAPPLPCSVTCEHSNLDFVLVYRCTHTTLTIFPIIINICHLTFEVHFCVELKY